MLKKKTIIIVASLSAVIIPIIAFNAKIIGKSGYSKEDEKANSLSLQIFYNGNEKVAQTWRDICFDFEDETDIEVNPHIGKTINTDMKNDWNTDNPPDFVWINGNGIGDTNLVKNGKFLDLTDWFEEAKVYGENIPIKQAIENRFVPDFGNGKKYEMPILAQCNGLYYDRAYMESKNYGFPSNYDELMDLTRTSFSNGDSMLIYPGKYASYLLWSFIMPAVASYNDTEFFNAVCSAKDPSIYDDARLKDVLTRFYDFVHFDKEDSKKRSVLIGSETFDHTQAQRNWLNNDALAIGNGMWLESEIKDSLDDNPDFKMHFTLSPLSKSTQKSTALLVPTNAAIATYAKHPDNAKLFLSYLYKEEVQQALAEAYSYLPVIKDPEYDEYTLTDVTRQTYETINNAELTVYKSCDWGTVGDIFNDVINCLVDGSNTVEQGIRRIQDEARKQ